MANPVQLAAKLYDCRDTVKRLLQDDYHKQMQEYGEVVRKVAAAEKCSDLEAGTRVAKSAGDGMTAVFVLAATVELIEPSGS